MMPTHTFVARSATAAGLFGLSLFTALHFARADPGGPPTTATFTFSGVLRVTPGGAPVDGPIAGGLTFVFHRMGAPDCRVGPLPATAQQGAFTVPVPVTTCGSTYFNGADLSYDVLQGTDMVLTGTPVTPVPYARFADQSGVHNDCPAGYQLDTTAADLTPQMRLCYRTVAGGRDEVMRVGAGFEGAHAAGRGGASVFWVDRHEASVWSTGATATQAPDDDSYPNLSKSGQWLSATQATPPWMAVSRPGVRPSRSMTWFQTNELCHAAGKVLLTREQWFLAVQGTSDPGAYDGTDGRCNTRSRDPRNTNLGARSCRSVWGVQDMIGNLWEWTAEWYAGAGLLTGTTSTPGGVVDAGVRINSERHPWPGTGNYGDGQDGTWNVASVVYNTAEGEIGIPSAAVRGGYWGHGPSAGAFALSLYFGPSLWGTDVGFRCAVPR